MNSFAELVKNRRSIRKYTPEELTPEEVEQILKAALMSPSSKHSNPWEFVLVEKKETLQKLALCKSSGCSFLSECTLAVVVVTDPMKSGAYIEDGSIAAIMMQLQAEDLGLGSCWVQIRDRKTEFGQDSEEYIRDLLDIPYQYVVNCILAFGRREKPGKPFDEGRLQWEKLHVEGFNTAGNEGLA